LFLMDRTAAERQAAFRKRMQARGFKLKQIWVDAEGFLGSGKKAEESACPAMSLDQLLAVLAEITVGADEAFQSRLYGELAAYARGVRELRDLTLMSPALFQTEGSERSEKKLQSELF
jgi:hypothetical protein